MKNEREGEAPAECGGGGRGEIRQAGRSRVTRGSPGAATPARNNDVSVSRSSLYLGRV